MANAHTNEVTEFQKMVLRNPDRPPSWRFVRASLGVKLGRNATAIAAGDQILSRLVDFLYLERHERDGRQRAKIDRWSPMAQAVEMHRNGDTDRVARVRALLLSGATAESIARRISENDKKQIEVIQLYEMMSFDVRDRLNDDMYITDCVLKPTSGFRFPDYTSMVCALGWFGYCRGKGSGLVDFWYEPFGTDKERRRIMEDLSETNMLKNFCTVLIQEDPSRRSNSMESLRVYVQNRSDLSAIRREEGKSGDESVRKGLEQMIGGIQLTVANIKDVPELAVVERTAVAFNIAMNDSINQRRGLKSAGVADKSASSI